MVEISQGCTTAFRKCLPSHLSTQEITTIIQRLASRELVRKNLASKIAIPKPPFHLGKTRERPRRAGLSSTAINPRPAAPGRAPRRKRIDVIDEPLPSVVRVTEYETISTTPKPGDDLETEEQ